MSYLKVKEMLRLVSELEDKIDESPDVDLEGASAEDICDLVNTVTGVIGNLAFMVGNMSGIYRRPPKKPAPPAFSLIADGAVRDLTEKFRGTAS